jgi:hypothetical protein
MFHADKVNPDKGQRNRRLEDYNAADHESSGDDSDERDTVTDESDGELRDLEHKADEKRRMDDAIQALEKYAKSFNNGYMETMPVEYASDDDLGDGDDAMYGGIDGAEGGSNNTKKKNTPKATSAYQPQDGSAVSEYLASIVADVRKSSDPLNIKKGAAWIPPRMNPISQSLGPDAKPNRFYTGNVWAFVWHPMEQFGRWMPAKHECVECKSPDYTTVNRWDWRPLG